MDPLKESFADLVKTRLVRHKVTAILKTSAGPLRYRRLSIALAMPRSCYLFTRLQLEPFGVMVQVQNVLMLLTSQQQRQQQRQDTVFKKMVRFIAYTTLLALSVFAIMNSPPASADVINDAVDAVEDAYDSTASWVDGAADTVGDTAEDAYDTVASATGSIIDDVSSAQTLAVTSAVVSAAVGLAANIL
ncbi:unnamed protein product [Phytophthora lilii]|uniref:Unnamed protein product n=1 Tax=Phytophthora lilii TaxID=2077276 RepID=A0A9W6U000_9STRA|nr:unnamed protein product [Phytophthora lilii]